MGAGKSSVALELSQRLECALSDIDEMIVSTSGMSIAEIFAHNGQSSFRKLETELLMYALRRSEPTLIACGGGIVLDEENVGLLQANTCVVYLEVSPQQVLERIKDLSSRPLLAAISTNDEIADIIEQRRLLYDQTADVTVQTDDRSVVEVCDTVEAILRKGDYGVFHS